MKKSNKILLYGLLASILLILLCLYSHQDEFMNENKDLVVEFENKEKPIENAKASIHKEAVKDIVPKEVKVHNNKEIKVKEKEPEESVVPLPDASTKIEDEENISIESIQRTIFKRKEELKLKDHSKVESVQKIEKVDKNFPIVDNKPLIDNSKSKKSKSKVEKKKISHVATRGSLTKENSRNIAAIQKNISEITSRHIFFYKNKAQLTLKSKETLNKVIKILKTVPNTKIIVKGYTDASGKAKTNLWISQKRANSVKNYLVKHGILHENIVAKGFGESELLYGDKPYSELNRRVEIEIKRR